MCVCLCVWEKNLVQTELQLFEFFRVQVYVKVRRHTNLLFSY